MPRSAMKPTEAGTERYWPDAQSVIIPPIIAKGMLARIRRAWRIERRVTNRTRKMSPRAAGTTMARRAAARF